MARSWRKLEADITDYLRLCGFKLDQSGSTGDIYVTIEEPCQLNITEFAKGIVAEEPTVVKSTPKRSSR